MHTQPAISGRYVSAAPASRSPRASSRAGPARSSPRRPTGARPDEAPALQPLREQARALAVVPDHLDRSPRLPRKTNRWPAVRIGLQRLLHQQRQARKAAPHVGVAGRQPHAHASREPGSSRRLQRRDDPLQRADVDIRRRPAACGRPRARSRSWRPREMARISVSRRRGQSDLPARTSPPSIRPSSPRPAPTAHRKTRAASGTAGSNGCRAGAQPPTPWRRRFDLRDDRPLLLAAQLRRVVATTSKRGLVLSPDIVPSYRFLLRAAPVLATTHFAKAALAGGLRVI